MEKYTYFCKSVFFTKEIVNIMKSKKIWEEVGNSSKICAKDKCKKKDRLFLPVNFFYTDGKYVKNYIFDNNSKNSNIQNLLSISTIRILTNKFLLNLNILELFPNMKKHIPISLIFDKYNIQKLIYFMKKYKYYIIKPVDSYGGKGIKIIQSYKDITNHLSNYKYNEWIIQKYITHPLLYKGYKFHLRTYLLLKVYKKQLTSYFYDKYWIYRAKKKYNLKNVNNQDIHITNISKGGKAIKASKLQEEIGNRKYNNINKQMINISKKITKMINKYVKCRYGDNKVPINNMCYEILGVDYMIDDNNNVVLLEINTNVGYSKKTKKWKKEFIESQFEITIDEIYKPNKKNKKNYFRKVIKLKII